MGSRIQNSLWNDATNVFFGTVSGTDSTAKTAIGTSMRACVRDFYAYRILGYGLIHPDTSCIAGNSSTSSQWTCISKSRQDGCFIRNIRPVGYTLETSNTTECNNITLSKVLRRIAQSVINTASCWCVLCTPGGITNRSMNRFYRTNFRTKCSLWVRILSCNGMCVFY